MSIPDQDANLVTVPCTRATFGVWPPRVPLPARAAEVIDGALRVTTALLLPDHAPAAIIVRFARDGVSLWHFEEFGDVRIEDVIRAIAQCLDPPAFAMAVAQPLRAVGSRAVHGFTCRGAFGDSLIEVTGEVRRMHRPVDERVVQRSVLMTGRATDDAGRWIGVPPTIPLYVPQPGAAEA